jgi:hypothetical protein
MSQVASFFAYPAGFTGGASVALADANNDGTPDIRATPGPGIQADVLAFDSVALSPGGPFSSTAFQLQSVPAFTTFLGGATVAGSRV